MTNADTLGISVSVDEGRIIKNLRKLAREIQYGTLEVTFRVHNAQITNGEASKTLVRI